jgi:2-amino-4-hydroxy-6-hydroxymethyldihydropteridine diphosphokinase
LDFAMSVTAYVALGSNLGDRRLNLDRALSQLREQSRIRVKRVSAYYETQPVGGPPGQGAYLNAALELETDLSAMQLLRTLLDTEQQLGRIREERNGPRTLDLDLLLYGDLVCEEPGLMVPHPRMHERRFVLAPLAEIAPEVVHPRTGRTIRDMLAEWPAEGDSGQGSGVKSASSSLTPDPCPLSPGRELAGLRALVTGSTSGIGRAIALALAAGGAEIVVHGRQKTQDAQQVAAEARALGVRSHVHLADLSDPDQCRFLVQQVWDNWGQLDIWINNAGADTLTGSAAHWPFERKLQELLAVDVRATVLLSREVGQRMQARGTGVIVNMGWDQADTGMEGDSGQLFGTAKGAVMAFSKSLAVTLAPQVRVNCLAPGWIRTAWGEAASPRWQERVRRETPLLRWGTPEDVAVAARWLVSPAAAFITGQIVRVDGGSVR